MADPTRPAAEASAFFDEVRHDLAREPLDLIRRRLHGPEHDRVKAVGHEPGERVEPPAGRTSERLAGQIADRQRRSRRRGPIPDQPLDVDDAPYRARVTTRLRGGRVDQL